MTETMNHELCKLMDEWRLSHQQRGWKSFISDGPVNVDQYISSAPKICFFLKEAYSRDSDDSWSLTEWLANGAMTKMWATVAEWVYGIRNTTYTDIPLKPQLSKTEKAELISCASIVNVKKSNGTVKSDYADLLEYAKADSAFLRRELQLLAPDVIVCGNNSSLLRLLYGASISSKGTVADNGQIDLAFLRDHGFALVDGMIVLDYYHPANQYPSIMNYYTVCSLYQQALRQKEVR